MAGQSGDGPSKSANSADHQNVLRRLRQAIRPGDRAGLGKQVVGRSAQTTILNLVSTGFAFFTSLVLTRLLGARGYGAYVYALAWATLLSLAAEVGWGHLLVRDIASYAARLEWGLIRGIVLRSQRVIVVASAVLVTSASLGGWLFVGHGQPEVRQSFFLALLLVPASALMAQREAVLRGYQNVALGRLPATTVQPAMLLAIVGVMYVLLGDAVSAPMVMAATVIAAVGAVAAGTAFVSWVTPAQVRAARVESDARVWARSARSLFAINGLQVVNLQMSILLLGAIKTVDSTAVFSVTVRVSGLIYFLQTAVAFPLAPAFAQLHSTGSKARMQRLASKAGFGVLVASSPAVLVLLLVGDRVLGIFGEQFRAGTSALAVMAAGELLNIASGFGGIILINTGQERTLLRVAAGLTALKIALSVPLISLFGLMGAALSQALGSGVMNIMLAVLVWRRLGVYTPGLGKRWFVGMGSLGTVHPDPPVPSA